MLNTFSAKIKVFLAAFLVLITLPILNVKALENNSAGFNVKVTTPNGGEQYKTLQDITIKWTDNVIGFDTNYVSIRFYKLKGDAWDPNAPSTYIDQNTESMRVTGYPSNGFGVKNVQSYTWNIPQFTSPGKYVAEVSLTYWNGVNTGFGYIGDISDNPFTISTDDVSAGAVPKITSMSPMNAPIGSDVLVTGSSFNGVNTVNLRDAKHGVAMAETTTLSSTSLKFRVPKIVTPGPYTVTVINSGGESTPMPITIVPMTSGTITPHPEGTNIIGTNGTVYRIIDGQLYPYTSSGAFLSYKFNTWKTVVSANSADMELKVSTFIAPRNGSLINDKGTVYLITDGKRAGFTSEAVFKQLGFSYKNVYPGDTSFMQSAGLIESANDQHMYGTLINDRGALYVMIEDAKRQAIPSMEVLDSWGYWPNDAVPANDYDLKTEINAVEGTRPVWRMNI